MLHSSPCGPFTKHSIVMTWTGHRVCHDILGWQYLQHLLPVILCPVICYHSLLLSLSLTSDQNFKSVPQSASFSSQLSKMWGEEKKERKNKENGIESC